MSLGKAIGATIWASGDLGEMAFGASAVKVEEKSEKELGWLAGIVDGEGCFGSRRTQRQCFLPRFSLTSRYDDQEIQREILRIMGCGKIYLNGCKGRTSQLYNRCPQFYYDLRNLKVILTAAIPIFDCCEFRSKKKEEYVLWRKLAFLAGEWYQIKHRPAEVVQEMELLHVELGDIKSRGIAVNEMYDYHWVALKKAVNALNGVGPR